MGLSGRLRLFFITAISSNVFAETASDASKKIKSHKLYCSNLIGQQKDVYLSGPYESQKIEIHIGDQLILRNIHSSGKHYPYWADFYWIEKRDE